MTARILVVEDNPANLSLMTYLLNAFGHTALEAVDGESGLAAARAETPDLVLLDLQLPGISGFEALGQMRSDPDVKRVPVVAVTAFAMVGDRENVLAAGFDGYIAKPIVPETFVEQVEAYLPAHLAGARAPAPASATPVASVRTEPKERRAVILVVDDSPANLQLSRSVLEPFGYRVVEASTVGEAMILAREHRPDMVLSDVHLTDGTGFDLLDLVRLDQRLAGTPVGLISSTSPASKFEVDAERAGAVLFMRRPIEPHVLLLRVEECLRGSNGS